MEARAKTPLSPRPPRPTKKSGELWHHAASHLLCGSLVDGCTREHAPRCHERHARLSKAHTDLCATHLHLAAVPVVNITSRRQLRTTLCAHDPGCVQSKRCGDHLIIHDACISTTPIIRAGAIGCISSQGAQAGLSTRTTIVAHALNSTTLHAVTLVDARALKHAPGALVREVEQQHPPHVNPFAFPLLTEREQGWTLGIRTESHQHSFPLAYCM